MNPISVPSGASAADAVIVSVEKQVGYGCPHESEYGMSGPVPCGV
jgi:hypothetical protein